MDVRWDQALDNLRWIAKQLLTVQNGSERLLLLSNQIQEKSKTWPLAKHAGLFSELLLAVDRVRMSRCQRT